MINIKDKIYSYIGELKGDSRSAKVKKNILGSFVVKGISILVSLILVPLTIGYVSSELYGIWLTLASVISWVALFDLGFGNGLRNRVAECIALNEWEKARSYVSTAYAYFMFIFSGIALIFYIVCGLVDWPALLNVSIKYNDLLVRVMRIIIVFFAINMVVKIQDTILAALQLNALASFFSMLGQLLLLLVTFILTQTTKPSLIYLACAISICPIIVSLIVAVWIYGFKYKFLRPTFRLVNKSLIRNILNLGINFFVIQIAVVVLYQTMNIIISNVAGPKSVTEYNVVYQYISVPLMATSMIVAPFWSAFTDAYTLKDYGWMKRAYSKLMKVYVFGVVGVLVMTLFYPIAFKIWLGDKVEIHAFLVFACALYVMIMIWNNIHSALINGTGCIKLSLYVTLIMIVVNIPLALFLGRIWGTTGVVMSVGGLNVAGMLLMRIQIKKIMNNTAEGIWIK